MNQTKTQKLSVKKIAEMCRSGQWTNTKTIDVVDFFIHLGNGEYKIDADTRFQVRGTDVDRERIKRAVNKIKASGDTSGL